MSEQNSPSGCIAIKRMWPRVRLIMGGLGLIFLVKMVDINEVSDALSRMQLLYLIPAWVLLMLSTATKTLRWKLLFELNGVKMPFPRLFGTYLIGGFYSQFLPGATVGGDAMRIAETTVETGRGVDSVAATLLERVIGLVTILVTAALILIFIRPADVPSAVHILIYGLSMAGITGLIVLYKGWFIGITTNILARMKLARVGEKIKALSTAFQGDLGNPRMLALMVFYSLMANAFSMTSYYLVLIALIDPVPYFSFISLVALIATLETIPITPGSLGIREGAYVFFLDFLGVSQSDALSIALLVRFVIWIQAFVGGLVLVERGIVQQKSVASPATPVSASTSPDSAS